MTLLETLMCLSDDDQRKTVFNLFGLPRDVYDQLIGDRLTRDELNLVAAVCGRSVVRCYYRPESCDYVMSTLHHSWVVVNGHATQYSRE